MADIVPKEPTDRTTMVTLVAALCFAQEIGHGQTQMDRCFFRAEAFVTEVEKRYGKLDGG